jgi:hypothetical protein
MRDLENHFIGGRHIHLVSFVKVGHNKYAATYWTHDDRYVMGTYDLECGEFKPLHVTVV